MCDCFLSFTQKPFQHHILLLIYCTYHEGQRANVQTYIMMDKRSGIIVMTENEEIYSFHVELNDIRL